MVYDLLLTFRVVRTEVAFFFVDFHDIDHFLLPIRRITFSSLSSIRFDNVVLNIGKILFGNWRLI